MSVAASRGPQARGRPALAGKLSGYLRSRATRLALLLAAAAMVVALILAGSRQPADLPGVLVLLAVCTGLIALTAPWAARIANRWEDRVALATAMVTPTRLVRLAFQLATGAGVAAVVLAGVVALLGAPGIRTGGLAALLALFAAGSAGWQSFGTLLAYRGIGNRTTNTIAAGVPGAALFAAALASPPAPALIVYGVSGVVLLVLTLALALTSDARSRWAPRRGIGVFFGTFNPFHKSHLAIIEQALRDRRLERIVIHPNTVPKLHAAALQNGEIVIARREAGMRVYERTARGDPNLDYFPTGNRFFESTARRVMIELALAEAGLADRVEVWHLEDLYATRGFPGVLAEVRRRYPGRPLHGIHGSDPGGMWVRNIFDLNGWIYPYAVRRIDGVSATAIRAGAAGMVSPVVEQVLTAFREDRRQITIGRTTYHLENGEMRPAAKAPSPADQPRDIGSGTSAG